MLDFLDDIPPGEDYQKAIVTAVKDAGVFLLLFSENANKSTEIPHELALAGKYKKTVIPARLQDIVPSDAFAYQMTSSQFIDLFHDFDAKINELCMRLAELLQISEDVAQSHRQDNQRRLEEQKRAAFQRKLKQAVILCGVAMLFIGGGAVWWIFTQRHATPSVARQGIASSSDQPPVSPSVAQNSAMPAPSAAIATPPAAVNATPAPSLPPVVSSPLAAAGVSTPPEPTITAPPAVSAPAVSSNPVSLASSEASTAQYALAVKSALATLAPAGPFVAGKYVDGGGQAYSVHGPGASSRARSSWSIELDADPNVNKQYDAAWTTGPVSQNPDLANQRDSNTLPEGFSYGFARQ